MQSKAKRPVDEDLLRLGRAIKALREAIGLTQDAASEAVAPEPISKQYWGMYEAGRVVGLHKPAVQRMLLDAINRAGGVDLTEADLAEASRVAGGDEQQRRSARLATALGSPDQGRAFDGVAEAVFPTAEGDVVVRFPAGMSPSGFKTLEQYLAVFLKAKTSD